MIHTTDIKNKHYSYVLQPKILPALFLSDLCPLRSSTLDLTAPTSGPSAVHFSQLLYHKTFPDFFFFANMIHLVNTSSFFSKSPELSPADQ